MRNKYVKKITKKLTATLVATITAFTLLFMAQPAQANVGAALPAVSAPATLGAPLSLQGVYPLGIGFRKDIDLGGCAIGAAAGAVVGGIGFFGLLFKAVRAAGPVGLIIGTAGSTVSGCLGRLIK